jgi:hypothetical protein
VRALSGLLLLVLLGFSGCATPGPRDAVPEALVDSVEPAGLPGVRAWGDVPLKNQAAFMADDAPRIVAKYREQIKRGERPSSNLLVLSGGADDGAFGAGLLVGWGEQGSRPRFDLVTGISAGALIAPFAFLGAEYDRELAEMFTKYDAGQIYQSNVLAGLFGDSSLAKSAPLEELIARYVDGKLLRRVAEERAKGRILLVGTTNIDAQRPVVWDMGKIAQSPHPRALETFRKVLLASASIPGLFPPVRFDVGSSGPAGGRAFQELHVDGGTARELFIAPDGFRFRSLDQALGRSVARRAFIIRNGKITPEWHITEETALALAQRSLETVVKNQALGDLVRTYIKAEADGIEFHLAYIPESFKAPRKSPFERGYMMALYETGRGLGRAGYNWARKPPTAVPLRSAAPVPAGEPPRPAPTPAAPTKPPLTSQSGALQTTSAISQ